MIGPLPPPVHGAAMMTDYVRNSKRLNDAVTMDWVNLSTSRSIEEIGKMSLRKITRFAGSYFSVLGKLLTRKYDGCYLAVTCHGTGFLKDFPFIMMCKMFGRKVIIHQHNKGMKPYAASRLYRPLLKMAYRNARVVLLSWNLYPDIADIVDKEQVVICPNGIPEVQPLPKVVNEVPVILFLSNLIVSKGLFVLLDACRILKDRGVALKCRIVGGESKEVDAVRLNAEIAARGLEDVVEYRGRKYGSDKAREYAEADLFVFPTFYGNETFGLVLLEAMQQGVPVVSTDEGGIPDIVVDGVNGYIARKRDAADTADKIEITLSKLPELGDNSVKLYKEKFSLERFEENLQNILLSTF